MLSIQERRKALEAMLNQKVATIKQLEAKRDEMVTEVVRIQGKLELLNELERESSIKTPDASNAQENKKEVSA